MFDWIFSPEAWLSLVTLTGLEIVLGIDNILFVPQAGKNLTLSIDLALQQTAVKAIGSKTGAIVVMEAATG